MTVKIGEKPLKRLFIPVTAPNTVAICHTGHPLDRPDLHGLPSRQPPKDTCPSMVMLRPSVQIRATIQSYFRVCTLCHHTDRNKMFQPRYA